MWSFSWSRTRWLLGLVPLLLPVAAVALRGVTGLGAWMFLGPAFVFGLVPLLDLIAGSDSSNPDDDALADLTADPFFRVLVLAYVPLQLLLLGWAAFFVGSAGLAWWELLGFGLTVGVAGGTGINAAHELGHKQPSRERWAARLALASVAYGHFFVEHNRGHHRNVATPEDPASSRLGESVYAFLPRTLIGSAASAWRLEQRRLSALGRPFWSGSNELVRAAGLTFVMWAALLALGGLPGLVLAVIQAGMAIALLETVNYLEHYGLLRAKNEDGRYEPCGPQHSWNSNQTVTNLLLYQLQRHADHHANPQTPYQALRHFDEAPQLPAGYAAMIPLAWMPPLWRRVMDDRVLDHVGGLERANVGLV